MPQDWTQSPRTGLRVVFILGRAGVCRVTPKPQSGELRTSLATMTEEGFSQPVEGSGEGPTGSRGGALYWAGLVHSHWPW